MIFRSQCSHVSKQISWLAGQSGYGILDVRQIKWMVWTSHFWTPSGQVRLENKNWTARSSSCVHVWDECPIRNKFLLASVSFASRSVTHSMYSLPSGPSSFLIWKPPSFARRFSSRALQPKWMVSRNQTVRKSDLGKWSPNWFASHSCWICVVVSPRALFGFCPLQERRSWFLLLAKASLAFENCMSFSILYCLPCSRKKTIKTAEKTRWVYQVQIIRRFVYEF